MVMVFTQSSMAVAVVEAASSLPEGAERPSPPRGTRKNPSRRFALKRACPRCWRPVAFKRGRPCCPQCGPVPGWIVLDGDGKVRGAWDHRGDPVAMVEKLDLKGHPERGGALHSKERGRA